MGSRLSFETRQGKEREGEVNSETNLAGLPPHPELLTFSKKPSTTREASRQEWMLAPLASVQPPGTPRLYKTLWQQLQC